MPRPSPSGPRPSTVLTGRGSTRWTSPASSPRTPAGPAIWRACAPWPPAAASTPRSSWNAPGASPPRRSTPCSAGASAAKPCCTSTDPGPSRAAERYQLARSEAANGGFPRGRSGAVGSAPPGLVPGGAHACGWGSGALVDTVPAGLGGEVGVVAGGGVVLGRGALAGVGCAGVVGVLVVAVGDRGHAGGWAGGDAEVVVEVTVVVAVGGAGDPALAHTALVDHRGDLALGPGSAAQDVEVLGEEHRPRLVVAGVLPGLAAGLVVGSGRGRVEDHVHFPGVAGGEPGVDGGGGGRAVVDLAGGAPVLAVICGVGQVHALVVGPGGVRVARRVDRDSGEVVAEAGRGAGRLVDHVIGEGEGGDPAGGGGYPDRHVDRVQRRAAFHRRRAGRAAPENLFDVAGLAVHRDVADLVVLHGAQVDVGLSRVDGVIGLDRGRLPVDHLALVNDDLLAGGFGVVGQVEPVRSGGGDPLPVITRHLGRGDVVRPRVAPVLGQADRDAAHRQAGHVQVVPARAVLGRRCGQVGVTTAGGETRRAPRGGGCLVRL